MIHWVLNVDTFHLTNDYRSWLRVRLHHVCRVCQVMFHFLFKTFEGKNVGKKYNESWL